MDGCRPMHIGTTCLTQVVIHTRKTKEVVKFVGRQGGEHWKELKGGGMDELDQSNSKPTGFLFAGPWLNEWHLSK